ncbi:MAG: DNA polymerase III subunit delta [Nitrospiraceae bacterium]
MKPHELASAIKKDGPSPLYLVLGEEDFLRDEAASVIKAAVLGVAAEERKEGGADGGLAAFNDDLLYGDESDAAEVLACAGQAPAFAPRRFVLLKAADKFPAREGEVLLPYLASPCDTTTLAFTASKLDKRQKFPQALIARAVMVDCAPLFENQLAGWIRGEAGRVGVRLTEDAILLLKEMAGDSLSLVRRELEKLAAYVPAGTVASGADVISVRGGEPGASVFDLTGAVSAQDRGRALRILARNLESGEAPLRILGSLVYQYRRLWKGKERLREGDRESSLMRSLGIPPSRLGEFTAQLRTLSEEHFRTAFKMFVDTDSRLKGGSAGKVERVLESLLLALCDSARGAGFNPQPSTPGRTKPIRTVRTVPRPCSGR